MLFRSAFGRVRDVARPGLAHGAVIAFIFLLCAVVVGHDLFRTWEDRSLQVEDATREVTNLAWAAAQHTEAALRLADMTLSGLVERVEIDGTGPVQIERLRRLMLRRQEAGPVVLSLVLIDEKGSLTVSGGPATRQMDYADRPYFQYHRKNADPRLYVSGLLRSRLTDKWVIAVSRRVEHADGGFAGVLSASIDVAYFQSFFATFDLEHDGSAALLSDDGTLLVRQPMIESAVGTRTPGGPPFDDPVRNAASGIFEAVSPVSQKPEIYAWRRVAGYPLVVVSGLGKDERLAAWRHGAAEHLFATVVTVMLLGFIGGRLVVQVRRLTRAEQATAAATAEARTAAAQYRLIADNASDVVISFDMQFIRRYVSPGCRDLLGYEPEELIAGPPFSLTHPEEAEWVGARFRAMDAGRNRDLFTCRARHRDGHWVWVDVSLRVIRDPDSGASLGICSAVRDVTQRIEAETALIESRRELDQTDADLRGMTVKNLTSQYARGLLEASLDPLLTISPEGKITDVNEATIKVTEKSRDTLIGTDFSDYFTESERAREAWLRVFASGAVTDYPLTIRHQNGNLTEVLYNASIYKDADGNVMGVFAAARDMTAQVTADREVAARRTRDTERLAELEQFQRLTVGRELKMVELRNEVLELKSRLPAST